MLKWCLVLACAYEAGAIAAQGRMPTITEACARNRALPPLVIAALAIHLYRQPRPPGDGCALCPDFDL
jgi:hypothetical protein